MDRFIGDKSAQAKRRKAGQQAANMLRLLPAAFAWTATGEQGGNLSPCISGPTRTFGRRPAKLMCLSRWENASRSPNSSALKRYYDLVVSRAVLPVGTV